MNLAGPFDFAHGGLLRTMVDAEWFDARAVAEAGNVAPAQMQSGFVALRPTSQIAQVGGLPRPRARAEVARGLRRARDSGRATTSPSPARPTARTSRTSTRRTRSSAASTTWAAGGSTSASIRCPVLTVAAERDTICPLPAARALNEACGSADKELVVVPGGHVGAVVGSRAPKVLYPAMRDWLKSRLRFPDARDRLSIQ